MLYDFQRIAPGERFSDGNAETYGGGGHAGRR